MPTRDLKTVYGGRTNEAINRAIRAECPGGAVVLDRIEAWRHICRRRGWDPGTGPEPIHVTAYRHLLEVADAMEAHIRDTYAMPPAPKPRANLARR